MTEREDTTLLDLAKAASAYLHAVKEARRTGRANNWEEAERKAKKLAELYGRVLNEERTLF